MNTSTQHFGPAHDLMCRYGAQFNAHPEPGSATLPMLVDGIHMLRLRALPHSGLQVSAWLRALPDQDVAREHLLITTGKVAAGLMREHAAHCVIDARERALWLQQLSRAHSLQDIDDTVGALINALAAWKPLIGKA